MDGGVVGTSLPKYEMDEDGEILSCSITVSKKFEDGYVGEFSALVFFDEYYQKGTTLWDKKRRTMIAKVAEVHALRKACPDKLSDFYIEEEMAKEPIHMEAIDVTPDVEVPEAEKGEILSMLNNCKTIKELEDCYLDVPNPFFRNEEVIKCYEQNKEKLSNTPSQTKKS